MTGARKQGDDIWHAVEGSPPLSRRSSRPSWNWERRHALMRTHSPLHVLCGGDLARSPGSVTGGNMEPLSGGWTSSSRRCTATWWPTSSAA